MQTNRTPESPVERQRAMQHALLTVRRAWAGNVVGFEGWGGLELDPEPLVIYDLNGQELFCEYGVMVSGKQVGAVKASASRIIGSPVPTAQIGPRTWNPTEAMAAAKDVAKERFPEATIGETELVCYCFPKIGVCVYFDDPVEGKRSLIVDVADRSVVDNYGADQLEGATAYSFYQDQAEPHAQENERRWRRSDQALDQILTTSPTVLRPGLTTRELESLRRALLKPSVPWAPVFFPHISFGAIRFAPHCPTRSHDCFVLYGQQTSFYCAVATGQMLLDFYRYPFTQPQIATAMGTGSGGTSQAGQVAGLQSLSNGCLAAVSDTTPTWSEAKAEIDANRPLKSGISGHARACSGWATLQFYPGAPVLSNWLRIHDPWPWNADPCQGGAVVWEDWDAVTHTNYIRLSHCTTPHA